MSQLKIYKSSAGSGKTYTLVQDFFLLALKRPKNFNRILAVTFTNKATAEMKSRILEATTEILEKKANKELINKLKAKLGYSEKRLYDEVFSLRYEILHNYGQFNISTIDSFFHKVIRSFARDMHIPVNFNISLDYDNVTNDVINEMFSGINVDDNLHNYLNTIRKDAISKGKSSNIKHNIVEECGLLHNLPNYVISEIQEFDDIKETIERFNKYSESLLGVITDFENGIDNKLKKIKTILDNHSITPADFTNHARTILSKWENKNYEESKTALKIYNAGLYSWTTTSNSNPTVIKAAKTGFHDIFCNIYELLHSDDFKLYNTIKKVIDKITIYVIYTHLIKQIEMYKKSNDMLLNHDITNFLSEILSVSGDAPFVYEKTGLYFRHFCIDEFQDTSPVQWNCFVPLLKNSISYGKENIIVGDVKQAIYRFRGGDWKLLNGEAESSFAGSVINSVLDTNYRSSINIVNTVGDVFEYMVGRLNDVLPGGENEDYDRKYKKIYSDVKQNVATHRKSTNAYKGIVQFTSVKMDKGNNIKWKELAIDLAIKNIEDLQLKGVPAGKICILVRNAREGNIVIKRLQEYQNNGNGNDSYSYKISSQDALYINQALVVRILTLSLSLFKVINKTDAKFVYLDRLLNEVAKDSNSKDILTAIDIDKERLSVLHTDIQSVLPLPFYDALEALIEKWELSKIENEVAYLNSFMDNVYEFARNTSGDPLEFLDYWNKVGSEKKLETQENASSIQLMTIHKSKGLQFDFVILPFLSWTLLDSAKHSKIMWIKPKLEKNKVSKHYEDALNTLNGLPYMPIKWSKDCLDKTFYHHDYIEECFQMIVENTNIMYVAMTRAKEGLFCSYEDKTNSSGVATVGKILDNFLESLDLEINKNNDNYKTYCIGNMNGIAKLDYSIEETQVKSLFKIKYTKSLSWEKRMRIRDINMDSESTFFGTKLHDLMSKIIYWEDANLIFDDSIRTGIIDKNESERVLKIFKKLEENSSILDIFKPEKNIEIKTEVPIIVDSGNQVRLDRLHINSSNNTAIIYDYKTGKSNSEIALAKYRNQLINYKNTVISMGFIEVKTYIIHTEIGKIEEVK